LESDVKDGVTITEVRMRFVELAMQGSFETAHGDAAKKSTFLVEVKDDAGRVGYAETGASQFPGYCAETHATVYSTVKDVLAPRVLGQSWHHPRRVWDLFEGITGNSMAKAGLEMACWDLYARAADLPLWQVLGGNPERRKVPVGVVVGLQPDHGALLSEVEGYLAEGYRRIKLKVQPGHDYEVVSAVRRSLELPSLTVDANESYTRKDLAQLLTLGELGIDMIEQPFHRRDLLSHGLLERRLGPFCCLDESIEDVFDLELAAELRATTFLNVKAARLGGYTPTLEVIDHARNLGIKVWCGGLLETGVGRAHSVALATLDGFDTPGDISATRRYFGRDVVTEPFELGPDSTLARPEGVGIGRELDVAFVDSITTFSETFSVRDL